MKEYKATLIIGNFLSYAEDKERAAEDFWDMWHSRDMSYQNEKDGLKWELILEETD